MSLDVCCEREISATNAAHMSFEAIVVGGGFTGMGAAAALAQQGAKVRVFEAAHTTDPRFRGELIHPRGVRALAELGLKAPLFSRGGVEVKGFAVTPRAGSEVALLPYGDEQGPGLGIDHPAMVMTLREQVAARRNVSITTGERITDFVRVGERVAGVRAVDGTEHRADLVVVADGRQSKLRPLLGLEPDVKLLSYTVAFGVKGELPHGRMGHVFLGAPGPILAYPYGEGLIRFCVDLPLGAAKGRDAMVNLIAERYAPVVPEGLREAMLASLRETPFEGCANHSISTSNCAAPGVVLVGDAGGCAHPMTASGMTNAMNDVLTLARLVGPRGPDDDALEEYQRRRYDFIRMRELFTDALYEVFRGQDEGSLALQAGVFSYWASSQRSRHASMDILSGEELRVSRFVAEYSRVFGGSAVDVFKSLAREPRMGALRLRSLTKTSFGRLSEAVERTARKVVDRYRLELHELP
jgi:2-polyprenyl-6-methoxyphenol hydroxylase-like FAD-dependent oxidoreductase